VSTNGQQMERRESSRKKLARRALERQLDYQERKAAHVRGREADIIAAMQNSSRRVRSLLEGFKPIGESDRVVEVGSGAHGLIFYFGARNGIGVDPLAVSYAQLFPGWQRKATTISAIGESLPFPDNSFEVVICDNVVDHAESPERIARELVRILKPGGMLYFTVNFHHGFYSVAASAHAMWRAAGVSYEIGPFADHTVHLTANGAGRLLTNLPIKILLEKHGIAEAKALARKRPPRHLGDRLKRLFYKNALYEVVATKV
jgi:SAM-dependent methyltransferase